MNERRHGKDWKKYPRRDFLKMAGVTAAGASMASFLAARSNAIETTAPTSNMTPTQMPTTSTPFKPTKVIDLEAHFDTPEFFNWILSSGYKFPGGFAQPAPFRGPLSDMGEGRIKMMDDAGITMQVISLFTPPHVYNLEPSDAITWAKRTNDSLAAACRKYPTRFMGLAAVPAQSPVDAVAELDRAITQLGLKGACLLSNVRNDYLDDQKYWPIFEKAQQLDIAVYLHPTYPSNQMVGPYTAYGGTLATPTLGFGAEVSLAVMRMIFSGLFDKYPKLKIILGHLGEGLPYWWSRLDFAWARGRKPNNLQLKSTEYLKRNFFVNSSGMFFQGALNCSIMALGIDKVGFGNDYPVENIAESIKLISEAQIPDSEKEKIFHVNAEKLFKL